MPRFRVTLQRRAVVLQSATVEVDAASEQAAKITAVVDPPPDIYWATDHYEEIDTQALDGHEIDPVDLERSMLRRM